MEFNLKNLLLGTIVIAGITLSACNNRNQIRENEVRDSLYQDSLRKDSILRESQTPADSVMMEDTLSTNNRELRTP